MSRWLDTARLHHKVRHRPDTPTPVSTDTAPTQAPTTRHRPDTARPSDTPTLQGSPLSASSIFAWFLTQPQNGEPAARADDLCAGRGRENLMRDRISQDYISRLGRGACTHGNEISPFSLCATVLLFALCYFSHIDTERAGACALKPYALCSVLLYVLLSSMCEK